MHQFLIEKVESSTLVKGKEQKLLHKTNNTGIGPTFRAHGSPGSFSSTLPGHTRLSRGSRASRTAVLTWRAWWSWAARCTLHVGWLELSHEVSHFGWTEKERRLRSATTLSSLSQMSPDESNIPLRAAGRTRTKKKLSPHHLIVLPAPPGWAVSSVPVILTLPETTKMLMVYSIIKTEIWTVCGAYHCSIIFVSKSN